VDPVTGLIFRHTVTRLRAPEVDDAHGNKVRDWGNATSVDLPGWAVDASGTQEDTDGRQGTVNRLRLLGPYGVDVVASDRLVALGETYEVEGDVLRQPGPSPRTSHTIVSLKLAKG
jgi:hypothetical protein